MLQSQLNLSGSTFDWAAAEQLPPRPQDEEGVNVFWCRGRLYYQGVCDCGQVQARPTERQSETAEWQREHQEVCQLHRATPESSNQERLNFSSDHWFIPQSQKTGAKGEAIGVLGSNLIVVGILSMLASPPLGAVLISSGLVGSIIAKRRYTSLGRNRLKQ